MYFTNWTYVKTEGAHSVQPAFTAPLLNTSIRLGCSQLSAICSLDTKCFGSCAHWRSSKNVFTKTSLDFWKRYGFVSYLLLLIRGFSDEEHDRKAILSLRISFRDCKKINMRIAFLERLSAPLIHFTTFAAGFD